MQFDAGRLSTWWTDILAVSALLSLIAAPQREMRTA
jgi:hypothetical protein